MRLTIDLIRDERDRLLDDETADLPSIERADLEELAAEWVGKVENEGLEAIGWYRSFHYRPVHAWGIYIDEQGLWSVAWEIAKHYRLPDPRRDHRALHSAFSLLVAHEYFHHIVDSVALFLEIATGKAVYLPYVRSVYSRTWNTADCLEEALANCYAYKDPASEPLRDYLAIFFAKQPPGYRDYGAYLRIGKGRQLALMAQVLAQRMRAPKLLVSSFPDLFAYREALATRREVPIYLLSKFKSSLGFYFTPTFEEVVDLAVTKCGYQLIKTGQRGSHHLTLVGDGEQIPLTKPHQGDRIPPGDFARFKRVLRKHGVQNYKKFRECRERPSGR